MRSQWADSERTLNVHWTCSERGIEHWGNWGKERIGGNRKKIQYLCFFLKITINCTDLLLFAAFWTVFNVCSTLRSLYVHCMFNVSFHQKQKKLTRDHAPVWPCQTQPIPCSPDTQHPWHSGLTWPIPFILILLRRCVKHGRVQWVGVLDVNVACGPKTKRNAFPRRTLSKVLSLQKLQRQSCKGGIQNTPCYASHAFLHRPHTFYDRYHALAMSWQWTYIERTLNMQWTRHRTLRKLRERANQWKSKENSIFVLFSENHNQLHRFAAICSFLDCVQCMFNVAFTVCSLYVQCQLPPETEKTYKRPCTCVTLSDPTYPMLSRHTTSLTLRTDLAYSLHTYPFAQVREAWSRAVSGCVGCECGLRAENKKKCFSETYPEQSALSAKVAKAEFKIHPVTLPTPSFTDLILFTTGTMRSQWADSERTLNVHWTCSERGIEHWGNWGKERISGNRKKIQYLCFFLKITINCTDLLLFAAFWTVFNVCSTLRSLYVHCMFNVSFHQKQKKLTRDHAPVWPCQTQPIPCSPDTQHPWHSGLTWPIPFILILLRRCVKHGRVQWVGVLDVNVACGPKTKRNAFPRRTLSKVLSLQKLQRQSCKGGIQNTPCYASHAFLHRPHTFYDRYHALAMSWQWTYIEHAVNEA